MELVLTLLYLSLAVGLALALSHEALRSSVRGALSVLLVLALVGPLVSAVGELSESGIGLPDFSTDTDGFAEVTETAFSEGVRRAVSEKYGLDRESVGIVIRGFSPEDMLSSSITVVLGEGSELIDYRAVRDFVAENFTRGGDCEVIYG